MGQTIGVLATRQIAIGVVEDNALCGPVRVFPEPGQHQESRAMTADEIVERIGQQVLLSAKGGNIDCVGVGFPGVIRNGVVEESPNQQQVKGFAFAVALTAVLAKGGLHVPLLILNDADAVGSGLCEDGRSVRATQSA